MDSGQATSAQNAERTEGQAVGRTEGQAVGRTEGQAVGRTEEYGGASDAIPARRPGRPRRDEGPAVTREAIVAAALRAVQGNGSAGLALREVARRLGVSLPTVQRHFATRDDLWRACVDAALEGALTGALPHEEQGEDAKAGAPEANRPGQGLERQIRFQLWRAATMPGFTAAMSNGSEPGSQERLDYLVERARPVLDRASALFDAAVESGRLRPADTQVVMALVALGLSSLASSREGLRRLFGIDLDDAGQREGFATSLTDILLYGLLPRGPEGPAVRANPDTILPAIASP